MENSILSNKLNQILPSLSGKSVHYDSRSGQYYTDGWTSPAGNTYYKGIRLSDRIVISLDLGQGYAYLFVNGIHIYGFNGNEKRLIASKYYHCCTYYEPFIRQECEQMVCDFLTAQLRISGAYCPVDQVKELSRGIVNSTYVKRIN